MLDYPILKAKPEIQIKSTADGTDTVVCKDLLSNVINGKTKLSTCKFVKVSKEYIARPDLISLAVYGTDTYADVICKINGISNPFTLNEGMELIIPDLATISTMLNNGKPSSVSVDTDNIGGTKKTNRKAKNSTRSPGEQIIGDTNFIIDTDNNIVIY